MKPLPTAESPHRGGTPPSLLRPSFRFPFPVPAAAEDEDDLDVGICAKPWVALREWWLATVEGDDQKLAVAGTFERKRTLHELSPAPIAKRHSINVVESEDGTVLLISGFLNKSRTLGCGYSNTVCEHFMFGFPDWWRSCNLRYPRLMNSNTGCQPCSSNIRNFGDQRTPVVSLEVQGCCEETQHMALTEKAAVDEEVPTSVYLNVQNSFSLSNGTPILEEYTCDGDIPTNEDAAASNDDNERYTAPSKEVNNVEIGLITGNPSRETNHDDIATDVPLAPTVESTNNAVSEALDSTPATVTCLKNQDSWGGNMHVASNKKPVGRPKNEISPHEKCQSATGPRGRPKNEISPHEKCQSATRPRGRPKKQLSPHKKCQSATKFSGSPISSVLWSPLTRGKAASLSMSTPESLELKRTRSGRVIVPTLDTGCQSIVYGKDGWISGVSGLDSPAMPKWKTYGRKKRRTE